MSPGMLNVAFIESSEITAFGLASYTVSQRVHRNDSKHYFTCIMHVD